MLIYLDHLSKKNKKNPVGKRSQDPIENHTLKSRQLSSVYSTRPSTQPSRQYLVKSLFCGNKPLDLVNAAARLAGAIQPTWALKSKHSHSVSMYILTSRKNTHALPYATSVYNKVMYMYLPKLLSAYVAYTSEKDWFFSPTNLPAPFFFLKQRTNSYSINIKFKCNFQIIGW